MNFKKVFILFFLSMFLISCSTNRISKTDNNLNLNSTSKVQKSEDNEEKIKQIPKGNVNKPDSTKVYLPDLTTEDGVKDYLIGDWIFEKEYISDVICKMSINEELKISLSFYNAYEDKALGDYLGEIRLDRIFVKEDEPPDLISIELVDPSYIGGSFFFLHRTIYDKRAVMSWFFEDYGDTIFNCLGYDEFPYAPEEIIFEKNIETDLTLTPKKNSEFYAVFWNKGSDMESLWIDEVNWTPRGYDEYEVIYNERMTLYENTLAESTLYKIAPKYISNILGDDLFPGDVYFVKTDDMANIIEFKNPEYKDYLESSLNEYDNFEIENLIFDIIENDTKEIKKYLDLGMDILLEDEIITIDGEDCYQITLGTNHEDSFVKELFYGVNVSKRQVYKYDALTDSWSEL